MSTWFLLLLEVQLLFAIQQYPLNVKGSIMRFSYGSYHDRVVSFSLYPVSAGPYLALRLRFNDVVSASLWCPTVNYVHVASCFKEKNISSHNSIQSKFFNESFCQLLFAKFGNLPQIIINFPVIIRWWQTEMYRLVRQHLESNIGC